MGFELQDGVFTRFVAKAKKKWEDAQKTSEEIKNEFIAQEVLTNFFSRIEMGEYSFKTSNGTTFYLMSVDDQYIHISIPENKVYNSLKLKRNELYDMLVSGRVFNQVKDITRFFGKINATQEYSYNLAIFKEIQSSKVSVIESSPNQIKLKPYIFIIDEINRGEISKIFGELFFAIDPGYRGKAGEVSTQYANLHDDPNAKFYIPENVYIIGTMNDIDRSVDSFDFAMRRRFRFLEIKADERLEMLECLGEELKEEAIIRMSNLNQAISNVEELNENYHIGASYFLKLKTMSFDTLWLDYLHPLLQDYIRGMYDEVAIMKSFEDAYTSTIPKVGEDNAYA
ncbi:MAG: AAA family ATPase [Kurthia sp.]|nr:AAA family ATPase [Candidatus Kurthia equi]